MEPMEGMVLSPDSIARGNQMSDELQKWSSQVQDDVKKKGFEAISPSSDRKASAFMGSLENQVQKTANSSENISHIVAKNNMSMQSELQKEKVKGRTIWDKGSDRGSDEENDEDVRIARKKRS
ncbi:MAG: hypothetical protein LBI69_05145 [Puniceicoccales bacterium]|jgi:hypothetical protein|nr:hypothetical protein [Puniceicoccales bacterium]